MEKVEGSFTFDKSFPLLELSITYLMYRKERNHQTSSCEFPDSKRNRERLGPLQKVLPIIYRYVDFPQIFPRPFSRMESYAGLSCNEMRW